MKQLFVITVLILVTPLFCDALTYRWTDNRGVIHFTDTLESVPSKYRKKMVIEPDITTRDPEVRENLRQQEQRAIQEESSRPKIVPTPEVAPPAAPPVEPPVTPSSPPAASTPAEIKNDESPPPRTKSQKIRDDIERRKLEDEKATQSGQPQQ